MKTFTDYCREENSRTTQREEPKESALLRRTLADLKRARAVSEQFNPPSIFSLVDHLSKQIIDAHQRLMADPSSSIVVKRLSYMVLCLHFIGLMAVSSSTGQE